jgi:hypothetical protein
MPPKPIQYRKLYGTEFVLVCISGTTLEVLTCTYQPSKHLYIYATLCVGYKNQKEDIW